MKEKPILFSAPMVRAILDGRKTVTRRVVKPQPAGEIRRGEPDFNHWIDTKYWERQNQKENRGIGTRGFACPYGQPGDRLWVRETFSGPWCMEAQDGISAAPPSKWGESSRIWYWADGEPAYGDWTRPRPSIHMPRWASRITLEVTGVRVETLQDIDLADALAEGISDTGALILDSAGNEQGGPIAEYAVLWEQINGTGSWDANPFVWVVTFRRIDHA